EEIATVRTEAAASAASISARIDSAIASLQNSDAQQQADIANVRGETRELITSVSERISTDTAALRKEANEFSTLTTRRIDELQNDLAVQQDDIVAIKSTLSGFNSSVQSMVERLDKQSDALHSMYTTYSQRESELEQVIE